LIIFPIVLWIFSKKYSWNYWKEKLSGKIILIESNVIKNNNE